MEEEIGIKVTRLRRRLSVESDDVKSPATPSTPTKKRGGRLAAKPQLDLIDENATEAVPKRTRKSTVKEIAEPVEEKAVTPSRRSTRIRSNTSIVSETPADMTEDKGTPSRRSTRIKSNTSIVTETVQNVNSPRAKRAARRTSLAGSDNEAPITPARQTRRTRKDSTSSVDKQADPSAGKLGGQLNEVIIEESENIIKETKRTESPKNVSPTLRKSPRLVVKSVRNSSSPETNNKKHQPKSDNEDSDKITNSDKSGTGSKIEQTNDIVEQNSSVKNNLSISSSNLINEINEAPKKGKFNLNKSIATIEEPLVKSRRNRTKSWTTISVEPSNDNSFCSDSEASKKKKKNNTFNLSNNSGSGDGIMNINNENDQKESKEVSLNSSTISNQKKKKRNEKSMSVDNETSVCEVSVLNTSAKLNKSAVQISDTKDMSKDITNQESEKLNTSKKQESSMTEKLFEQAPSGLIQSLVFIEDSDSNNGSIGKRTQDVYSGDQCVPVIDHHLEDQTSNEPKSNISYEPMDIDETMPENVTLSTFSEESNSLTHKDKEPERRKSTLNITVIKDDSINKSKRKSKILDMISNDAVEEGSDKSQIKSATTVDNDFMNNDANKSKKNSSISNMVPEDTIDGVSNMSNHKSLLIDNNDKSMDKKSNKSVRKSSISNMANEDNMNEYSNNSNSIANIVPEDKTVDNPNKSLRKSSVIEVSNGEITDKSLNKSKRKSSVSVFQAEISVNKENSSILDTDNDDIQINNGSNKSKRKSSISNTEIDDSMDKKYNKSKRKSSISSMASHTLDKTGNENKSTLVLSQIKDVSENEINVDTNVPKYSYGSDEQLSKSINLPNINTEKESDKHNLSLTYSTSTPLQQKSIKKLGMQINSSIIAPNSVSKLEKKNTINMSKKEASILSQVNDSDSSEEDFEEESSLKKSKIIDDEAEEASDDYESGDSRDDDEKEYEEQNEIVEKGETLDSDDEDEYSEDSDYEKGSFIVSSDEEDNDLLSGSGDDLSMSADELSMTAKSKKKYNERKIKEQKKASREMFEARHKLNESDRSAKSDKPKAKKNNRQRLDSSSSDSDDEVTAQPKKNRRQRIDSSQDISTVQSDADKSLSKKKNKAKRLSESVCEDNAMNEKEITVCEGNHADKIDPLELQNIIKKEPNTPQRNFNISTVAVTNIEEVEEVNVEENISFMKSNQTSDPLQATVTPDDAEDEDDEDSISENEEISQNYESVLNNLNKANSKKVKSLDISLNLNKKTKHKTEPIVDQLNLTKVKKSKKKKGDISENTVESRILNKSANNKSTDKVDKQINVFSEGSSDSIDMKLLFPEDSNDSEVALGKASGKGKKQELNEKEDGENGSEDFIPLKRTEGKTNMLANMDIANKSKDESILNVSNKKKNKLKSFQTGETVTMNDQDSENLSFFIDTTGTLIKTNKTDDNTSVKNSATKNKQKINLSFTNTEETKIDEDDSNDAPLEVSYRSEKNKSKQDLNTTQNVDNTQADTTVNENTNRSATKKKKNKKELNSSKNVMELSMVENTDDVAEQSVNISGTNVDGSAKKKKKKVSESQMEQEIENEAPLELAQNVSLGSAKKQKAISESSAVEKENINKDDIDIVNDEEVSKKRKRKSSANQTIEQIIVKDDLKLNTSRTLNESLSTNNQKKKRKISHNGEDVQTQNQDTATETYEDEKVHVKNTKKKNKVPQYQEVSEIDEETTKKNKKRKERDDDDACKISKIHKQNSFDKIHVPRLPANVLNCLEDKPATEIAVTNKSKVISTTSFVVEETKKRRNKPSNYLEESVYLNDDLEDKKQKGSIKNPKVLPFIPTASTSDNGFTTNFRVNIIPQQTQFVAQSSDKSNFKNDYLHKKRIKKLGTFEMYKRQRNIKISKF